MTIHFGDCLDVMAELDDNSIDAVVTDPPYGLEFMGKEWDKLEPAREHQRWAEAALRVLKPGGHLVAFGGTRTHHRLWCALEDAGFEIRDTLMWLYGSGFPKSLDVSKAIDKAAGAEREVVGTARGAGSSQTESLGVFRPEYPATVPATGAARRWRGWGTALKPAWEPIVLARKPLVGTVAANVQEHGTGALNIDACRLAGQRPIIKAWESEPSLCDSCAANVGSNAKPTARARRESTAPNSAAPTTNARGRERPADTSRMATGCSAGQSPVEPNTASEGAFSSSIGGSGKMPTGQSPQAASSTTPMETDSITGSKTCASCGDPITIRSTISASPSGRWPANACLDEEAAAMLDVQSGEGKAGTAGARSGVAHVTLHGLRGYEQPWGTYGDSGGASRFFYCAKASRSERGAGNNHPTVKPLALMRWLCRLVTPPGGLILDPFVGSATTALAAVAEGFRCIGIDNNEEYCEIARERLAKEAQLPLAV